MHSLRDVEPPSTRGAARGGWDGGTVTPLRRDIILVVITISSVNQDYNGKCNEMPIKPHSPRRAGPVCWGSRV
jgi:hypothetical protein